MKELQRTIQLFEKLYEGEPWIDVNIKDTLNNLSAEQAAKKVYDLNSIWEIVNHITNWRKNVLKRINGKVLTTPAHNYFEPVSDTSDAAWTKTLTALNKTQVEWLSFLKTFHKEYFSEVYPKNKMTYYEHIHGILQHDAYHLGQIKLLVKLV